MRNDVNHTCSLLLTFSCSSSHFTIFELWAWLKTNRCSVTLVAMHAEDGGEEGGDFFLAVGGRARAHSTYDLGESVP